MGGSTKKNKNEYGGVGGRGSYLQVERRGSGDRSGSFNAKKGEEGATRRGWEEKKDKKKGKKKKKNITFTESKRSIRGGKKFNT